MGEFQHLGDDVRYRGEILDVVRATYRSPAGERFQRDVVRVSGAVATVPIVYTAPGAEPEVVLIAQYRPAVEHTLLEIPAGKRDVDGEADEVNARRELAEEVGLVTDHLELLAVVWQSPGMADGTTAIYLADGCRAGERTPIGPEEEHSEVVRMPLVDALRQVSGGTIADSKTVIGLLLAGRRLGY